MNRFLGAILAVGILMVVFAPEPVSCQEYLQVPGVIHIHTHYSSGRYSIAQLVEKARELDIEVLAVTDHDRGVMEYGAFPLRHLAKVRKERPSVLKNGVERYLATIASINRVQSDVIVIPGVQSSPFYYWSGSPFTDELTAHLYRKELLVLGMQSPADYENLPILHNGLSARYATDHLAAFLICLAGVAAAAGVLLVGYRKTGGVLIFVALLFAVNYHPFKSSPFDPYHGDQGIAPYQEFIDYARQRGGLVFWAHPESNYSIGGRRLDPITLTTPHYPEAILEARDFTGFSALYGDTVTMTAPGMHWDMQLNAYCQNQRAQPAWGISGADFHEGAAGVSLDTFQTVFLVQTKTPEAVFEALSTGRCYAIMKKFRSRLVLDEFGAGDAASRLTAVSGETAEIAASPVIHGKISAADGGNHPIHISLVIGGSSVMTKMEDTPVTFAFRPDAKTLPYHTYCRLIVESRVLGKLLSNPIFLRKTEESQAD